VEDLERNTVKDEPSRIAILNASLDAMRQIRRAKGDAHRDALSAFCVFHLDV